MMIQYPILIIFIVQFLDIEAFDFMSKLREILNITEPHDKMSNMIRGDFLWLFSSAEEVDDVTEEHQMNTLIAYLLLEPDGSDKIKICCPKSLYVWHQRQNFQHSEKRTTVCTVSIPEPQESSWDSLNAALERDSKIFAEFPKSKPVATLSLNFRAAVSYLAREFLLGRRKQEFYGKICFLNSHPKINRQLLDYAVTSAILSENDFSHDLLSPLEMDPQIFFGTEKNRRDDSHQIEPRWSYYREDPLLHVFYAFFHKIYTQMRISFKWKRANELFLYTHQQMIRRAALERRVQGLPALQPLGPARMAQSLGRGSAGWAGRAGRRDNCSLGGEQCGAACTRANYTQRDMMARWQGVKQRMWIKKYDYKDFRLYLTDHYGLWGHNRIGYFCSTEEGKVSLMNTAEMSARDPMFYRWHTHLGNLDQEYRDKRLPSYHLRDFQLSDGIKVLKVKTLLDKEELGTEEDVKNVLVTFDEMRQHGHGDSKILYRRLNHVSYRYQIKLDNPLKKRKKVIVRLWLGLGKKF